MTQGASGYDLRLENAAAGLACAAFRGLTTHGTGRPSGGVPGAAASTPLPSCATLPLFGKGVQPKVGESFRHRPCGSTWQ